MIGPTSSPAPNSSTPTVALCGLGYWGRNYFRVLSTNPDKVRLKAVFDLNTKVLDSYSSRNPDVTFTSSFDSILEDPEIEAVFIVTPACTHFELGKKALLAGKHALVEKPLATNSDEALELVNLAKEKNLLLMVGFTVLFIPSIVRAKNIIDSPEFGKPYYINSIRTNLGIVRPDVNVNWDLAPHDLAIFTYWLKSKPVLVSAMGSSCISQSEDCVFATVQYENGVLAHLMVSWGDPQKCRDTVIVSSNMRIAVDDINPLEPLRIYHSAIDSEGTPAYNSSAVKEADYGTFKLYTKEGDLIIPRLMPAEPLAAKIFHFLKCFRDNRMDPVASGKLGAMVVRMCEAIDESMKKNGAPVSLKDDEVINSCL